MLNLPEDVTQAIKARDSERLASAITRLLQEFPDTWEEVLIRAGFIGRPTKPVANKDLLLVLDTLKRIADSESDDHGLALRLMTFTAASLSVGHIFETILNKKKQIEFFRESAATRIFVVAYYVESQLAICEGRANDRVRELGFYADDVLSAATVPFSYSPGMGSLQGAMEGVCEVAELMLRETLHQARATEYGPIRKGVSAYGSPDFERAIVMAAYWRKVEELWTNVQFGSWRMQAYRDGIAFEPRDSEFMIREAVSTARYNRIMHTIFSVATPDLMKRASDDPRRIQKIADSLQVHPKQAAWDGTVDLDELREASETPFLTLITERVVRERHYAQVVPKMVGKEPHEVCWRVWTSCCASLRILAAAVERKMQKERYKPEEALLRVRKLALVDVLSYATRTSKAEVLSAVELLTLDPRRKKLEIWDQPLLPISQEDVLLLPRLTQMGSTVRAIENFALEYGAADFASRGGPFEAHIAGTWRRAPGARVKQGLKAELGDKELQFDVVVYWDKKLILCEAKCLKSVHDAADERRAWKQVSYSIDQLMRRKRAVLCHWEDFRENAPDLELPEVQVIDDDVVCLAVNNLTQFTGMVLNDVPIVDDVVLARFFDDPAIRAVDPRSGRAVDIGQLRGEVSAKSLVAYVRALPQVSNLRDSVTVATASLPPLEEGDPVVVYAVSELASDAAELEAMRSLVEPSAPVGLPQRQPFPKVGRNSPCPCGSGKKYKRCHIR